MYIYDNIALNSSYNEGDSGRIAEKITTHISCSTLLQNRAVYEIIRKNTTEPDMSKTTKWRIRFAWWIPTATNTHSEYVTIIALPLQKWLHARASVLRYTNVAHLITCATYLSRDTSRIFF